MIMCILCTNLCMLERERKKGRRKEKRGSDGGNGFKFDIC